MGEVVESGYSPWLLAGTILCAVAQPVWGYSKEGAELALFMLAWAALIVFVGSAFMLRVRVSEEGVGFNYLVGLGRNRLVLWDDLVEVGSVTRRTHGVEGEDFHFRLRSGKVIKFSSWSTREPEAVLEAVREELMRRNPGQP